MPAHFDYNKLESISDQLTVGLGVEEIAVNEKCSTRTIYHVQRRLLVTGQATPFIPCLKSGPARMVTPEIEEV